MIDRDLRVGRLLRLPAVLVVVAVWLAVAVPTGAGASSAQTPALVPIVLPRDHASHPGLGIEWWYTTGRLTAAQGGRYAYFATVWSAPMGLVARINIVVDLRADQSSLHWNWFACQLTDGRALMLYQFLGSNGAPTGIQAGTLVRRDGPGRHLQRFTITPHGPLLHPAGAHATYPQAWTLSIPSAHLNLSLRSLAANQFIWMSFVPSFWEGAAAVTHGAPGSCVVESTREPSTGGV